MNIPAFLENTAREIRKKYKHFSTWSACRLNVNKKFIKKYALLLDTGAKMIYIISVEVSTLALQVLKRTERKGANDEKVGINTEKD